MFSTIYSSNGFYSWRDQTLRFYKWSGRFWKAKTHLMIKQTFSPNLILFKQIRRKPGREMITFLLVCNFAMWAINTLETRKADSNPLQMNFYGFWAWTIITHVTTPLTIFFRFHSTVCLCDIWKRTYKVKPEYLWTKKGRAFHVHLPHARTKLEL